MNSITLKMHSIFDWHLFSERKIILAPTTSGIYIMRKSQGQQFGRLCGESDILYIGSTKTSLKKRLRQYFHPGPTQLTNIRINYMLTLHAVEISWLISAQPRVFEAELLQEYFEDHDELPPFNAQGAQVSRKSISIKDRKMNKERVLEFLEEHRGGICDDCLSLKLGIKPRQTINMVSRGLRDAGYIIRERKTCSNCTVLKIVNETV